MANPDSSRVIGLRVAIIGLGRMGLRHLQATQNLGMSVCALADISQQALDSVRMNHGCEAVSCFTDAHAMLDTTRPDALVVATTAPTHAEFVLSAAEKGVRYILCEKPMASSLAETDEMTKACRRAGATLAVNHQMMFMPQYTEIKSLIGSDELGPLTSILVAGSNFGLAMNASHYFEMYRYVSGESVTEIQAWLEEGLLPNPRGVAFEDRSGRLLARSAAGPTMFIDFSVAAGYGLQVVYICRHGQIVVDELCGSVRVAARKPEFRDLPTSRYGMPADVRNSAITPADTIVPTMAVWSAMLDGAQFPDADAGAHAVSCLVAAHTSHDAGGLVVRLDDPALPRERVFKWA